MGYFCEKVFDLKYQ